MQKPSSGVTLTVQYRGLKGSDRWMARWAVKYRKRSQTSEYRRDAQTFNVCSRPELRFKCRQVST